jgi:hypothetical protein
MSDISHTEQIAFIVRIVNINTYIVAVQELFLGFYSILDTTGEDYNLDVQVMCGQRCDNGSNMRGKHVGLQNRIKNIKLGAFFVPCLLIH